MKLFLVTHKGKGGTPKLQDTYIAAISMELVARHYDASNIELVNDKVMVLKTPEDLKP